MDPGLVDSFGWDVIDHLNYNPDLAPNDFHLLLYLKQYLGSKHFDNGEEMKVAVSKWLREQAAEFYAAGI